MGIFINEKEIERLQKADPDSLQWKCYQALKKRALYDTRTNRLVQITDTQEWYHLCWERLSDVSFLYRVEKNPGLGQWLHDRTMEIVRKEPDEWIGPWYRARAKDFQLQGGSLETAHIALGICEAIDNCPELFSEDELQECKDALFDKGMLPCVRFCEHVVAQADSISNWFVVILDGFATAAVLLKKHEYIKKAIQYGQIAASIYNRDSYGESIQYSGFATLHLSHMNEVMLRSGAASYEELNLACYANLIPWYASSFLYMKELEPNGAVYPRTVNFGDSAAIFRVPGDVLVQIASRCKEWDKTSAGVAAWLFERQYENPELGPNELASFGMFNQFQYASVLGLPDCAAALSPEQAGYSKTMFFECGQILARDSWESCRTVAAIQAGYKPCHVTAHNHRDQNSFQIVYENERFLIDPGHCCYRLKTQREAVSELAHNTITLLKDGTMIAQKPIKGNIFKKCDPGNQLLFQEFLDHVQIIGSDMAGLYDDMVERATRIWILNLPHQIATIDIVKTKEKVSLCTHFTVNNRDGRLQEHHYSDQRLVLRRNGKALKLFEMFSVTDGEQKPVTYQADWTAMHNYYHPLPNQAGQGKEGSARRYLWTDEAGMEHIRIHTFVMDSSEEIVHWHVYLMEDAFVRMEAPEGKEWIDIKATMDGVTIRSHQGKEHTVKL